MQKTSIQWTDLSVNPIRASMRDNANRVPGHYCEKISPGCELCYSSRTQPRFGMPEFQEQRREDVDVFLDTRQLKKILRRRKPAKIFWCDMTDLFGDWVPDEWIDQCLAVMALTPHLTHQILTKRSRRMREHVRSFLGTQAYEWRALRERLGVTENWLRETHKRNNFMVWPLRNIHAGVSVESPDELHRVADLQGTPAHVRWISAEPLLAPISFDLKAIDWVVVGGESGPGARPMHPDWARKIRDDCQAAGVAYFFKQWGAWAPYHEAGLSVGWERTSETHGRLIHNDEDTWPSPKRYRTQFINPNNVGLVDVGKKAAGRLLDGREWNEFPK